ncbi:MAG: peroxide stress protein YaaA [Porcipelethomonas sp.]
MKIIISPAKKMNVDTDILPYHQLPQFLPEAMDIMQTMQKMSDSELQALWKCNDAIAKLNITRLRTMNLQQNLTPAILAYEGIQYQYMAPGVFTYEELNYIEEHLRILSGFYGLLRPFDGVVPYRLEMQAKLRAGAYRSLYEFWGNRLAGQLASETDRILNLASKEYSKAVTAHLPETVQVLTCTFGEWKSGKIVEKGTLCKMARGQMVRWLAENQITAFEDIKAFGDHGYVYDAEHSASDHYVFIKGEK